MSRLDGPIDQNRAEPVSPERPEKNNAKAAGDADMGVDIPAGPAPPGTHGQPAAASIVSALPPAKAGAKRHPEMGMTQQSNSTFYMAVVVVWLTLSVASVILA